MKKSIARDDAPVQEEGGARFWRLLEWCLLLLVFSMLLALGLQKNSFLADEGAWVAPLLLPLALVATVMVVLRLRFYGGLAVSIITAGFALTFGIAQRGIFEDLETLDRIWMGLGIFTLFSLTGIVFGLVTGYFWRAGEIDGERRSMLREILDSLPVGLWVRARSGETVFLNHRFVELSGEAPTILKENHGDFRPLIFKEEHLEELERVFDQDTSELNSTAIEVTNKEGNTRNLDHLFSRIYIDPIHGEGTLSLLVDETESRAYEDRVLKSESRLQSALTNADMGIWDQDLASGEVYCDGNWFRILGLPEDCAENPVKIWKDRLHPDDKERVLSDYVEFFKNKEESIQVDYRVRHGVRQYIWVQNRLRVFEQNELGEATRVMGTMQDISDRKQIEIDLQDARDRAEAGSEAKGQFIATVSHEIRTPLNAIIGLSSFLAEASTDAEQHELATTIHASGKSLLVLVNDILDFSKIEAGRMELVADEFPLRLCFEECLKLYAHRAKERNLRLRLSMKRDLPEFAVGDMERLRQIVQNLIANGIKFTEKGEIEVIVRRASLDALASDRRPDPTLPVGFLDDPDHDYLEVIVRDTGIGISKDNQTLLFSAFTQGDASTTRKYGGTGLGLAICKRLVIAMGGRIWMESDEGRGSIFGLVIRTKLVYEEESVENVERFTRSPFGIIERIGDKHPCDILIVGDSNETESVLQSCRKLGYTPHHSKNYDLSSRAFKRRRYNVVFVSMVDEGGALSVSRQMSPASGAEHPDCIIGMLPEGAEAFREHSRLNGITQLIHSPPRTTQVRSIIMDVLGVRG